MERITIISEDLSLVDCGGGTRQVSAEITIDVTLPLRRQRRIVAYEVLATYLETMVTHRKLEELAEAICDAQDELGGE